MALPAANGGLDLFTARSSLGTGRPVLPSGPGNRIFGDDHAYGMAADLSSNSFCRVTNQHRKKGQFLPNISQRDSSFLFSDHEAHQPSSSSRRNVGASAMTGARSAGAIHGSRTTRKSRKRMTSKRRPSGDQPDDLKDEPPESDGSDDKIQDKALADDPSFVPYGDSDNYDDADPEVDSSDANVYDRQQYSLAWEGDPDFISARRRRVDSGYGAGNRNPSVSSSWLQRDGSSFSSNLQEASNGAFSEGGKEEANERDRASAPKTNVSTVKGVGTLKKGTRESDVKAGRLTVSKVLRTGNYIMLQTDTGTIWQTGTRTATPKKGGKVERDADGEAVNGYALGTDSFRAESAPNSWVSKTAGRRFQYGNGAALGTATEVTVGGEEQGVVAASGTLEAPDAAQVSEETEPTGAGNGVMDEGDEGTQGFRGKEETIAVGEKEENWDDGETEKPMDLGKEHKRMQRKQKLAEIKAEKLSNLERIREKKRGRGTDEQGLEREETTLAGSEGDGGSEQGHGEPSEAGLLLTSILDTSSLSEASPPGDRQATSSLSPLQPTVESGLADTGNGAVAELQERKEWVLPASGLHGEAPRHELIETMAQEDEGTVKIIRPTKKEEEGTRKMRRHAAGRPILSSRMGQVLFAGAGFLEPSTSYGESEEWALVVAQRGCLEGERLGGPLLASLVDSLNETKTKVADSVALVADHVAGLGQKVKDSVSDALPDSVVGSMAGFAENMGDTVSQMAESMTDIVSEAVAGSLSETVSGLSDLTGTVSETVSSLSEAVQDTVVELRETVEVTVLDLTEKVADTVDAVSDKVETITETVQEKMSEVKESVEVTVKEVGGMLASGDDEDDSDDELETFNTPDLPEFRGVQGMDNYLVIQEQSGPLTAIHDFYIFMLKTSLPVFSLGMFCTPILLSLVFTLLYLPDVHGLALDETAIKFLEAQPGMAGGQVAGGLVLGWYTLFQVFMFSLSLSTGLQPELSPLSPYALIVANTNALVAELIFVFLSGAVFARLSQPSQPVRCSKVALICPPSARRRYRSEAAKSVLMCRYVLAGPQPSELVDVKVDLTFKYNTITRSGSYFRAQQSLKLVRPEIAYQTHGMLVRHVIDETSPLFRRTPDILRREDAIFSLSVVGLERSSMQSVFHVQHYSVIDGDIVWDAEFDDMVLLNKRNKRVVDQRKLSNYRKLA